MGLGFVVARFGLFLREVTAQASDARLGHSRWFGIALVGLGVVVVAAAHRQHRTRVRQLSEGAPLTAELSGLQLALTGTLLVVGCCC